MTQVMVMDIMNRAFFTIIKVSAPTLMISLVVGLLISILQATTQIQEQTLSFVPKVLAVILSIVIFGNFMLNELVGLTDSLFRLIPTLG